MCNGEGCCCCFDSSGMCNKQKTLDEKSAPGVIAFLFFIMTHWLYMRMGESLSEKSLALAPFTAHTQHMWVIEYVSHVPFVSAIVPLSIPPPPLWMAPPPWSSRDGGDRFAPPADASLPPFRGGVTLLRRGESCTSPGRRRRWLTTPAPTNPLQEGRERGQFDPSSGMRGIHSRREREAKNSRQDSNWALTGPGTLKVESRPSLARPPPKTTIFIPGNTMAHVCVYDNKILSPP